MKKLIPLCFFALLANMIQAQSDCSGFVPFKDGVMMEHTHYDAKNKVTSRQEATVHFTEVEDTKSEASLDFVLYDAKDEKINDGTYQIFCENGFYKFDISTMGVSGLNNMDGMKMTVTGDKMEFPNTPIVGTTLPDANTAVVMSTSDGVDVMTINVQTTDRKVESQETVTTSAGTFDCFVFTQKSEVKMLFVKSKSSSKTYFSPKVGIVKQENFDKKGKLESLMVLTKLKQ